MKIYTYSTLLDTERFARYIRALSDYSARCEHISELFARAVIADSGESSLEVPYRLVYDARRRRKRLVTTRPVPDWRSIELCNRTFYYPNRDSSLFDQIGRRDYALELARFPNALEHLLDRVDLLAVIEPIGTPPMQVVVDQSAGTVTIHSTTPIEDRRFVEPSRLSIVSTMQH